MQQYIPRIVLNIATGTKFGDENWNYIFFIINIWCWNLQKLIKIIFLQNDLIFFCSAQCYFATLYLIKTMCSELRKDGMFHCTPYSCNFPEMCTPDCVVKLINSSQIPWYLLTLEHEQVWDFETIYKMKQYCLQQ